MTLIVRVYGVVQNRADLQNAFAEEFGEEVRFVNGAHDDDVNSSAVWGSHLILCGFDSSNVEDEKDLLKLLVGVIKAYGAWSYLPQIIFGTPTNLTIANRLERLAASRYLKADLAPKLYSGPHCLDQKTPRHRI